MSAWDDAYRGELPPQWDIGRAQPEFERLVAAGAIRGRVIDIGCGTGENALMAAGHGLAVVGVDIAPAAIERARSKALERRLSVEFIVHDVLELADLAAQSGPFDSAIDSGVFHTFADGDRPRYSASVGWVVKPGGRLFLMCFSQHEPYEVGPRRVSEAELAATFSAAGGWSLEAIEAVRFVTIQDARWRQYHGTPGGARAWLATIRRA